MPFDLHEHPEREYEYDDEDDDDQEPGEVETVPLTLAPITALDCEY